VNAVTLVVRHRRSGRSFSFPNRSLPSPPFFSPNDDPWASYEGGQFSVRVPFEDLCSDVAVVAGDIWDLELRVEVAGFCVSAPVTRVNQRGSAAALPSTVRPDGSYLVFLWQWRRPLRVRVDAVNLELTGATLTDRVLTGMLKGDTAEVVGVEATAVAAGLKSEGQVVHVNPHSATVSLALPELSELAFPTPLTTVRWKVRALLANGKRTTVAWPNAALPDSRNSARRVVALDRTRFGRLSVVERQCAIEVDRLSVTDDGRLTLTGHLSGHVPTPFQVAAANSVRHSDWAVPELTGDSFQVTLPLRHTEGRFGSLPLRAGEYTLVASALSEETTRVPLTLSSSLQSSVPVAVNLPELQADIVRGAGNAVQLSVRRPLDVDARGRYKQSRWRSSVASGRAATPAVLLQSYFGESATDNGVGLQRELARRDVDLPVYWAVRDYSVPVPEGGTPVIKDSSEWYRLLRNATYYMDNMYQPDYHSKPPGQTIIQTFHGYPFKTMGYPNWVRAGFSTQRIDSYARRSAEWDYLVSPAAYATPLLRRDFRYDGEVLEIGYPRNDVLSDPSADKIRYKVREAFGIEPHQTAVLYAPTYRDYLSPDDHRAEMVDFVDLDGLNAALGEDFIVLVRGHAFNARVNRRVGSRSGVIDVTDYPEVSDLYLAADAAIVDYSSLRFDFAVTGKPMIFHVPDLQRYVDTRGWLFDFGPTAPGPLVTTNEEIISALASLDEVRVEFAASYQQFRNDYLSLEDGRASARLVDAVFVPRGDAPASVW
jgi:CDP-glycerol glycerophosphotransferase